MKTLAQITSELVGRPFALGNLDGGFDCAGLLLHLAKEMDIPLPEEWEGFTVDNYRDWYLANPDEALNVLFCWVHEAGEVIDPSLAFAGDILIVRIKGKEDLRIVMHAGQDLILGVFEAKGVDLAPIRAFEIVKAIRWRKSKAAKLKRRGK